MEIVIVVLAGAIFLLGLLTGVRVSERILRGRERRVASLQRDIGELYRHQTVLPPRRVYVIVDADLTDPLVDDYTERDGSGD